MRGTKKEALTNVDTILLLTIQGELQALDRSIGRVLMLSDLTAKGSALYSSLKALSAKDKLKDLRDSARRLSGDMEAYRSGFIKILQRKKTAGQNAQGRRLQKRSRKAGYNEIS